MNESAQETGQAARQPQPAAPRRQHRWLRWIGLSVLVLLIALGIAASVVVHKAEPYVRAHIVEALSDRFHARVELDEFHLSLLHGLQAEGHGLRIWPPAQVRGVAVAQPADAHDPLLSLRSFSFGAPLHYQPGKPFYIALVSLDGLDLHIPPKSHFGHTAPDVQPKKKPVVTFSIGAIRCTNSHFVLETSKPGKLPLDFALINFQLSDSHGGPITHDSVMNFIADLQNPRPDGIIHTTGSFGKWNDDDPGESPITGQYSFSNANLGTFKGISGTLNSTGRYQGTLRDLIVDGDTDTPDFALTHFGNTMPLHTHFHARVDATNGDTWLEPVDAVLGHSHFTAQGQIVRVTEPDPDAALPGHGTLISKGHDIALNVAMQGARMEDFLYLTSNKPTPLMTGSLTLKAALHIPPGPIPVHKRITLKGSFHLDQVKFASASIQSKITDLSMLGEGHRKEMKDTDPNATRSTMQSPFAMANGVIALPALQYTVPGATIALAGNYGVDGGTLDFTGKAKLDATVGQIVGGFWGKLLTPANIFFKKDGAGTEVPIKVDGTRQDPHFGLDFHHKKDESPAAAK